MLSFRGLPSSQDDAFAKVSVSVKRNADFDIFTVSFFIKTS
jgi:hypothetical protein